MKNDIKQHKDYDIDDWISHFENKESKTDIDVKETKNTLHLLKRIKKNGDLINPKVYMYLKLMNDALTHTFNKWEYILIKQTESIIIYNEMVYIELYEDNDNICCSIGFSHTIKPYISSYIAIILNDMFDSRINIIESVFMINVLDNTFIWGTDEIKKYNNIVKGYVKVKPFIIHNTVDDNGNVVKGNC